MRMRFLLLASLSILLLGGTVAVLADTPPITTRAGIHPDFDRVVFDWPRAVAYKIQRDGEHVTVHFDAPGNPKFDSEFRHLTRAHDFATSLSDDGNMTVTFTVDAKAVLKDFLSEKSVVIDIQGPDAKLATSQPEQKPEPKPEAKTEPKPEVKQEAKAAPAPAPAPVAIPSPPPAAQPTPPAPVQTAKTETPTPAPVQQASPPPPPQAVATPPAATSAPALPPLAPLPPVTDQAPAPSPAPVTPVKSVDTVPKSNLTAQDITDTPLLVASLDPHTATRAVIFLRGGYGYIIFERKLTLTPDALTAGQPAPRVVLETLNLPKASGFRFAVPVKAEMRATRSGTAWQIFLTQAEPNVPVSTALIAQPDFALGARYILPLPDAPEPVRMMDPVVGDDLILVPLEQTEAFSVGRRMADFQILPAAQGLVIRPLNEKIVVRAVTDGVEITMEGGLHLSSNTDTGASQQSTQRAKITSAGKSVFDFAAWTGKPEETYTQTRQRLQQTIVDVPEAERNRARLELARFYFAHGNGEEAVALLDYLAKQVPDLTAHADFMALLGASQVLSYRPEDGLKNLGIQALVGQLEIELWQAVAYANLREWPEAEEKFALTETMLNGYPEPFYSRFSVLAIESALAMNKDHEAADWLEKLENGPHLDDVNAAIDYLHGVLHAKGGRAAAAEEAWRAADASRDRLYKVRAELALIDLGVANGSLTPVQAADRLEALRFGWRGDDLEVDILHRLGQFYIQSKNVKAGLNILSRAVQLFPNSPMSVQIHDEMSGIFRDVFLGELGKDLSALDALTLYQQYRSLMPPGPDGIAVTHNLAERLVAIDLLDQASELLEDLVKNRLQGEDKAKTSTRLAAIRLLDHKPELAVTALDLAKDVTVTADLQNERLLLRAKALSDMRKDDDALALLKDNTTDASRLLRADITMHAQHWSDAAKALLDLVGEPKEGVKLSHDQAGWLVNAAIALSLAGDSTGLDKLAIDYGPAMAEMPENDTFRMLTQPDKTTQPRDIASAQARIADVDMFRGFLNNYRKNAGEATVQKVSTGKK